MGELAFPMTSGPSILVNFLVLEQDLTKHTDPQQGLTKRETGRRLVIPLLSFLSQPIGSAILDAFCGSILTQNRQKGQMKAGASHWEGE